MSEKTGEGVIQSAFADHLARKVIEQIGLDAPYVSANLQGKSDKQFADYFTSINSKCLLIEFKEFKSEIIDEKRKPLREDLCALLANSTYTAQEVISARGHFLAFGDIDEKIENIQSYSQAVCPIFSSDYAFSGTSHSEKEFLEGLIKGSVGITIDQMNQYVITLTKIAQQGKSQTACPEFKALLLSYDSKDGEYKKERFNDLCELQKIMELAMKKFTKKPTSKP